MSRPQSGVRSRPQSGVRPRPQSGVRPRPQSGVRSRPQSGKWSRGSDVSYEDLLVAQYLEELRKAPRNNNGPPKMPSPYAQLLANTHIVPTPHLVGERQRRARPHSAATVTFRPGSASKPRMDPRFIADPELYDPATPRGPDPVAQRTRSGRKRPVSAPAFRRPLSAAYGPSRPSSAKSSVLGRAIKAKYREQVVTIVVCAFKNGSREVSAKVAAPNIKVLLEMCTDRLALPHAARRLFLADGTEVFDPHQIHRDADIFVSMGENFKNASKEVKQQSLQQRTLAWTLNGLAWAGDIERKPSKQYLSKRFRKLLEPSKRRILVFKNSHGTKGVEIVADENRFEEFLAMCTSRLELGSYARNLYDWEGKEIKNLKDAPVLDECLQTWSTPVHGPLWVSTGECFSPKGVKDFLMGLINYTRAKKKEAQHYQTQLMNAKKKETRDDVSIVAILSMSEVEIKETLEVVQQDLNDFGKALNRLNDVMENLKDRVAEEESMGTQYKIMHVEEYSIDHRLVGTKGIRLKVYENGSCEEYTEVYFNVVQEGKAVKQNPGQLLARLLDKCSEHHALSQPKNNTAMKPVAQRLYDKAGKILNNVLQLKHEQEVWLSFGEAWKNPFTLVLTAQFDKIRPIDIQGQKKTAIREQLMSEDRDGYDKPQAWEAVTGIPETTNWLVVGVDSDPAERDHINNQLETGEIDINADFLCCKKRTDLVVYVEPTIDTKKKKGSKDLWPPEAQEWVITKEGTISAKFNFELVLAVSRYPVTCDLRHPFKDTATGSRVEGFVVSCQQRTGDMSQTWRFTNDGTIESVGHSGMCLTYVGTRIPGEEVKNESEGIPKGIRNFLAVCPKLDAKDAKAQRWAIKQEKLDNLGQWKYTQSENPEWNKRALSWPVDKAGDTIDAYDWPMEGFLLAYAPPIKVAEKKKTKAEELRVPRRLMALRNGVRDVSKAISVVGPDLSNMRKDVSKVDKKSRVDRENKKNKQLSDTEGDDANPKDDLTVLKLEFILFLERCTQLMDLPFAARRVFDETGKEHFSLKAFSRDELLYVSCGEPWTDPNLSKAEQQRRYLLANLGSDVAQMKQFIALRDPCNLVLEAESLNLGARIIVNGSVLVPDVPADNAEVQANGHVATFITPDTKESISDKKKGGVPLCSGTAHEASHASAEERFARRKWPWERSGDPDRHAETPVASTNDIVAKKQKTNRPHSQVLSLQRFTYDKAEGYIACTADTTLVLGVQEVEGNVSEVILMRRRVDDVNQRWIIDNGLIVAKANTTRVLSVVMPSGGPEDEHGYPLSYVGSEVALQSRKVTQFGGANQKWAYNADTGLIEAFDTTGWDKEVTAANKANVCTYSVMWKKKLDQPGYRVELPDKGGNKTWFKVCSACARAMRGRHKLEKLVGNTDFACIMGEAKALNIKLIGSFQCLNGKVDLSTAEAEHTLTAWETQLEKLREELSVRAIANKISAARVPFTIKVLAYKNGDGRMKPGELVIGSSVAGILGQCTYRLGLTQAARRLYTADGLMILQLDDLVRWVQDNYVAQAKAQLRAQRMGKTGKENKNMLSSLMDKVDLEDEELEEEEEEDDEEEKEETPATDESEDFAIGYQVKSDRKLVDEVEGVMLVPNPAEEVEQDGFLYLWNFYCSKPGKLFVQILRSDVKNVNAFHVVEQADFDIKQPGEYSVDMTTIEKTPWLGKGMPIKKGDVIGFYCPGPMMLPYDLDAEIQQAPYFYQSATAPVQNDLVDMLTWQQNDSPGTRQYSLNAYIRPVRKPNMASPPKTPEQEYKKKKPKTEKSKKVRGPHVKTPPVELVLKYPIEVWVSVGESFKKPEGVERQLVMSMQQREQRSGVAYELEKEKHILRQMQGRRMDEMSAGQYKATMNPTYPVLIEGHWQEPTPDEQEKHNAVHKLQTHLSDMRTSQKGQSKTCNVSTTNRLYAQPAMKRVLVLPNGESLVHAVYIWGETVTQLLDNATSRLNLRKAGRYLFNMAGKLVSDMSEVERDQVLCVSYTKTFQRPKESQQNVEVKANWSRARKQYGASATDIVVEQEKNPSIDVDPFGPSQLVNGSTARNQEGNPASASTSGKNQHAQDSLLSNRNGTAAE